MKSLLLAKRLFPIPTAPYFERFVLKEIANILDFNEIPYFFDSSGNLIAGVKNKASIKPNSIAYIAHTDHPGFHIKKEIKKNVYSALWLGGAPFDKMKRAKLRITCSQTSQTLSKGVILEFSDSSNHRDGIPFTIKTSKKVHLNSFGSFDFPGLKMNNEIISTKAADDLAGCVMALGALIDLYKKANILAVFTRAEEVGFVGCLGLIQDQILPKSVFVVSLEASRTLPGATLGDGPVIRLGDASTLFDSNFSLFIQKCAQKLKQTDSHFKFQKRIMDGGSCEATALSQFGYTTMGLAVPLGNYHNMGSKGPAPEKIHVDDLENGYKLLVKVASEFKNCKKVGVELQKRLKKLYISNKKYLREIDAI